jgi:hypothetical protein
MNEKENVDSKVLFSKYISNIEKEYEKIYQENLELKKKLSYYQQKELLEKKNINNNEKIELQELLGKKLYQNVDKLVGLGGKFKKGFVNVLEKEDKYKIRYDIKRHFLGHTDAIWNIQLVPKILLNDNSIQVLFATASADGLFYF